MAKKRKYRKKGKVALQKNTVYTLTGLGCFLGGLLLLVSYSRSGDILTRANDYLVGYFGGLSFLVPFVVMGFAFLFTKIKNKIASPSFSFGFATFVLALIGLFHSGLIGQVMYDQINTLLGPFLTISSFVIATLLGFFVFTG